MSLVEPMPSPQQSSGGSLAEYLSEFAPPTPSAASVTAAILAATREELGSLAQVAVRARAVCRQSAPLTEALRAEVARELAELEVSVADNGIDPQRLAELRDAATEALTL